MPMYDFVCVKCEKTRAVYRPMKDCDLPEVCECGERMLRDFVAEHCAIRGDYNKPIVSESMAFDAIDIEEHRKRFPDVDVIVDHDRSARPILRNLNQKRRYMRARGFVDTRSF